jgi:hypothetical protein
MSVYTSKFTGEEIDERLEKAGNTENYDDAELRELIAQKASAETAAATAEQAALNKATLGYQRKNLLKNTAASRTINGINLTVNDDGSMTFNAGTSTGLVSQVISKFTFKAGVSYIITGAPDDGTKTTRISLTSDDGTEYSDNSAWDTGSGCVVRFESDTTYNVRVRVCVAGTTLAEPVTFYPMIRSSDISDDTYEKYAAGVEERLSELEERLAALEEKAS